MKQAARLSFLKRFLLSLMVTAALTTFMVSTAHAQTRIVLLSKADSIRIAWHHDWCDTTGAPDLIAKFRVFASANDTVFAHVADVLDVRGIGKPDTTCMIKGLQRGIKYTFGVMAVDVAGNESALHTSAQPNAAFGGWYVIMDNTPPRAATRIRPL